MLPTIGANGAIWGAKAIKGYLEKPE